MADFVSKGVVKSAERKLIAPIDTFINFLALIQDVIENNPWGVVVTLQITPQLPVLSGVLNITREDCV